MAKFKIRFVLNDRNKEPNEQCSISARIYWKKYNYIDTGIEVYPSQFDYKYANEGGIRVIQAHPQKDLKNDELKAFYDRIDKIQSELRRSGKPFSIGAIKRKLKHEGKTATECFEFVLLKDQSIVEGTKKSIKSTITRLNQFAPGVMIHEIDYTFAKNFEGWLQKHPNKNGEPLSINTINKYLRDLKRMLKKSIKWDFIKFNPLEAYDHIAEVRDKPGRHGQKVQHQVTEAFTDEDILKMLHTDFQKLGISPARSKGIEYTIDMVVFSCDTGLRLSDLLAITKENVKDGVLIFEPQKGMQRRREPLMIELPLNMFGGRALEIFKKYTHNKLPNVPVFNRYSKPSHQANIIKIREHLFPNRKLSIHSARHSFETRLEDRGVNPFLIQRLMGHSSVRTTVNTYNHSDWKNMHQELNDKAV